MCPVPLSIKYSWTTMSNAIHKLTLYPLRHGIPLFLKGGPQVIGILDTKLPSADPKGVLLDSGLERVQAATFEKPQSSGAIL